MAEKYYLDMQGAHQQLCHYYHNTGANNWMLNVETYAENNDKENLLRIFSTYREIVITMKPPRILMKERCLDNDVIDFSKELTKLQMDFEKFFKESLNNISQAEKLCENILENKPKIVGLSERIHMSFDTFARFKPFQK